MFVCVLLSFSVIAPLTGTAAFLMATASIMKWLCISTRTSDYINNRTFNRSHRSTSFQYHYQSTACIVCIMFPSTARIIILVTMLTPYGGILHNAVSTVWLGMIETYWCGSQTLSADLDFKWGGGGWQGWWCLQASLFFFWFKQTHTIFQNKMCGCRFFIMRWFTCATCVTVMQWMLGDK